MFHCISVACIFWHRYLCQTRAFITAWISDITTKFLSTVLLHSDYARVVFIRFNTLKISANTSLMSHDFVTKIKTFHCTGESLSLMKNFLKTFIKFVIRVKFSFFVTFHQSQIPFCNSPRLHNDSGVMTHLHVSTRLSPSTVDSLHPNGRTSRTGTLFYDMSTKYLLSLES